MKLMLLLFLGMLLVEKKVYVGRFNPRKECEKELESMSMLRTF